MTMTSRWCCPVSLGWVLLLAGCGSDKDEARAAALFTKACEGGEASGCFNLGGLLLKSRSVGKDKAGAAAAFARGCALGHQNSCAKARK